MIELTNRDQQAVFRGMGGGYMKNVGLEVAAHYEDVALMGFLEVLFGFRRSEERRVGKECPV
jgi:lipid-A-disaccharide synthase